MRQNYLPATFACWYHARHRHSAEGGNPMFGIRRREFITLLGGAAAWPVVARAQQADRVRRIGWLDLFPEDDLGAQARNIAFRRGMEKLGWIVGRNLVIDYRWGVFDVARARAAAAELLNLAPDVIMSGGTPGALALQQATRTVPIVFAIVSEPVTQGIVASLAHPGGNRPGLAIWSRASGPSGWNFSKKLHHRSPVSHSCSTRIPAHTRNCTTNRSKLLLRNLMCRQSQLKFAGAVKLNKP